MVPEQAQPVLDVPPTPSEDEWRALEPHQREALIDRVNAALSDPALAMTEGRPHFDAKLDLLDALGLFYRTTGRAMYLAAELAVLYPGERGFAPDILAVADVPSTPGDRRMAWVVADEGRGIDVAIEILHAGDRRKDLVDNVERYARVGVAEYFVYDGRDQRVVGYRLPDASARRYQRILPQNSTVHSAVLGVDFAVQDASLRVFVGTAELPRSIDYIDRLAGMLAHAQGEAEQAQGAVEKAQSDAQQAQSDAQKAQSDARKAQIERDDALVGLRTTLLAAMDARGLRLDEAARARIERMTSLVVLQRWLLRSLAAVATDDVFAGESDPGPPT